MDRGVAQHLLETPLSQDQTLEMLDEGRVRITATVKDTGQLRWWLMGFGAQVEVIGPESVRQAIAGQISELATVYQ